MQISAYILIYSKKLEKDLNDLYISIYTYIQGKQGKGLNRLNYREIEADLVFLCSFGKT